MTTLFDAIERADAGTVWKLAKEGARLDEIEPETELTPLALAATSGQAEIVRTLLEVGADPNWGGATTPLEAAVVEGHREVVDALLAAGVDVDRRVADGFTPLMTAAATGDIELVRTLLAAGARTRLTNDAGETAMALAKAGGHSAVIDAIRAEVRRRREETAAAEAEAEAAPPQSSQPDETPGPAGDEGDADARDESARAEDARGETDPGEGAPAEDAPEEDARDESAPADARAEGDRGDEARAEEDGDDDRDDDDRDDDRVESAEAEADAVPAGGEPAEPAAEPAVAPPVEVPAELLEAGGEAAAALARDVPAFAEAVLRLAQRLESDDEDLEAWLEDGGLDVHARDAEGRTPLMAAAYYGDPETVRALLRAGAETDVCDATDAGHSPLVYAVRSLSPARLEVISDLVAIGADVNRPCGRNQRTPLMHAAEADVYLERDEERGFALTTRHLIRLGADLEARDRRGNTVWRLVKRASLGAPTFSSYRRRLHQMLRALENLGARPVASHRV